MAILDEVIRKKKKVLESSVKAKNWMKNLNQKIKFILWKSWCKRRDYLGKDYWNFQRKKYKELQNKSKGSDKLDENSLSNFFNFIMN